MNKKFQNNNSKHDKKQTIKRDQERKEKRARIEIEFYRKAEDITES